MSTASRCTVTTRPCRNDYAPGYPAGPVTVVCRPGVAVRCAQVVCTAALFEFWRNAVAGAAGVVVVATGEQRRDRRLSSRQLGAAIWYRAGAGSVVGVDAGADRVAGCTGAVVRLSWRRPAWTEFPCPVPVPVDGYQRRLPDRRPVQPVCLF